MVQEVQRPGSGKSLGWGDQPGSEAVVRDVQLHCPLKEGSDGWVELAAGEELEPGAEGSFVDEDAGELLITGSGSSMSWESL
jgi:hypothetical protein